MTEEDKKLLNTFEAKLRHFMYLHDELKHENAKLKQLLTEKNEEVRRLENSRKELEVMYTNLRKWPGQSVFMIKISMIQNNGCQGLCVKSTNASLY